MNTEEKVRKIKQSFRLYMNGVAAQSMRDKGMDYKINWGLTLPHLREMAAEYDKDKALATALWGSDVRECRLLATMLMPPEECDEDTACRWVGECVNQEQTEMLVFNLLQNVPCARAVARKMLFADDQKSMLCAYHLLSRLISRGYRLDEEMSVRLTSAGAETMRSGDATMRHAAMNCVTRYLDSAQEYADLLQIRLKDEKIDIF